MINVSDDVCPDCGRQHDAPTCACIYNKKSEKTNEVRSKTMLTVKYATSKIATNTVRKSEVGVIIRLRNKHGEKANSVHISLSPHGFRLTSSRIRNRKR